MRIEAVSGDQLAFLGWRRYKPEQGRPFGGKHRAIRQRQGG